MWPKTDIPKRLPFPTLFPACPFPASPLQTWQTFLPEKPPRSPQAWERAWVGRPMQILKAGLTKIRPISFTSQECHEQLGVGRNLQIECLTKVHCDEVAFQIPACTPSWEREIICSAHARLICRSVRSPAKSLLLMQVKSRREQNVCLGNFDFIELKLIVCALLR